MKVLEFVANLLMPQRCLFCASVVGFAPGCDVCNEELQQLTFPVGSELDIKLCNINASFAPYIYSGCVRNGIINMKFNSGAGNAERFAFFMAQHIKACNVYDIFDIIIAVPSSKKALRKRGYDVPHLLAKELSKQTGIFYLQGALIKQFDTAKQATLSAQKRKSNLVGAFEYKQGLDLSDKNVLLVDDILTTGATLNECAKILLFANAKTVYTVCIAQTLSDSKKE